LGDTGFHLLGGNQKEIRSVYAGPEEPLNADAFDQVILGARLPRKLQRFPSV
jgi:hypothetical protein